MSSLDSLPADQRAVLQLVLQRGRSYEDIARLLSIDRAAVRQRAVTALGTLGPRTGLPEERRAMITDYLLGQLPDDQREQTRQRLAENPGERAWARVIASELAPLTGGSLPEIPVEADAASGSEAVQAAAPSAPSAAAEAAAASAPGAAAEAGVPSAPGAAAPVPPPAADREASAAAAAEPVAPGSAPPPAPPEAPAGEGAPGAGAPGAGGGAGGGRGRTSRLGGLILIAGAVVAVVVVALILLLSGGSSHKTNVAASSPTTSAPAASTSTSASTSSAARVVAQINLTPPQSGSKAAGIAEVLKEGANNGIALVAQHVPPNTKSPPNAYAVWLYNSPADSHILGFINPGVGKDGRLSTAGGLPTNAAHYKMLIVTVETHANPKTPGTIVLQGALTGLS
jgi:Sigma-70, region 4